MGVSVLTVIGFAGAVMSFAFALWSHWTARKVARKSIHLTAEELEGHLAQAHADGYESRDQVDDPMGGSDPDDADRRYASGYRSTLWS